MPSTFVKRTPAFDRANTPIDLLERQELSPEMMAYLWLAMEMKMSVLFCGPPDVEKPKFLNAVAYFVPQGARVASISQRHTWTAPHGNWYDAKCEDWKDLKPYMSDPAVKQSEYVFLEKLQGAAVCAAPLLAMEKRAVCATVDVDGGFDEFVESVTGPPLGMPKVQFTAIHVVASVQDVSKTMLKADSTRIISDSTAKVTTLTELVGYNTIEDKLIVNEPYWWEMRGKKIVKKPYGWFFFTGHSFLYEEAMETWKWTGEQMDKEILRRIDFLRWLFHRNKRKPEEIVSETAAYAKSPETVAEKCRDELKDVSLPLDGKHDDGTPLPRKKARLRAV